MRNAQRMKFHSMKRNTTPIEINEQVIPDHPVKINTLKARVLTTKTAEESSHNRTMNIKRINLRETGKTIKGNGQPMTSNLSRNKLTAVRSHGTQSSSSHQS